MTSPVDNQMNEETSLRDYGQVLWRRRWYVVVPVVIAVIGAIVLMSRATPVYRAETTLRVNSSAGASVQADPFARPYIDREAVASFVELAKTPTVRRQVAANLDLGSRGQGLGKISVTQIGKTEFFRVTVEHPEPVLARDVANEVARVIKVESEVEWERRVATAGLLLELRLEQLQEVISGTRQALTAGPDEGEAELLQLQLAQYESQYSSNLRSLEESRIVQSRVGDVLLVQAPATTPGGLVGVSTTSNLLLAAMLGLVLGGVAAFLREYLDNTAKSPEDVHRLLGVPVVGAVPQRPKVRELRDGLILREPEGPPMGEAYHMLRTNLQFSKVGSPSQLLLVTSSQMGEGKTTTMINLGVAMAQAGKRVVLVDVDLRRPQLHAMFDLPLEGGAGRRAGGGWRYAGAAHQRDVAGEPVDSDGGVPGHEPAATISQAC